MPLLQVSYVIYIRKFLLFLIVIYIWKLLLFTLGKYYLLSEITISYVSEMPLLFSGFNLNPKPQTLLFSGNQGIPPPTT